MMTYDPGVANDVVIIGAGTMGAGIAQVAATAGWTARLRDVDEAQMHMVTLAKDLAGSGEIVIVDNKGEDELVY